MINVEFKKLSLAELRRKFDPDIVARADRTAITRTARKVRTQISKDVREIYAIKAGDIGKAVRLIQRKRGPIEERLLLYTGKSIPMEKFNARRRRVKSARGRRYGVSVKIRKDKGQRLLKKAPRGFASPPFLGKGRVLARTTDSRKPVKFVYGPSIAQMVANDTVVEKYHEHVRREYPIELERAMRVFTGQV